MASFGERLDDLESSDIFTTSLSGLAAQLRRFFPKKDIPVVQVSSENHFRALFTKNKRIKCPFFAYMITSLETPTDSYNPYLLYRQGVETVSKESGPDIDNIRARLHFQPVKASVRVLFITDDNMDILNFSQRWLMAARQHYLDFIIDVDNTDTPINIKVNMEQQITVPTMENVDIGESYVVDTTLTIDTYHGVVNRKVMVSTTSVDFAFSNYTNEDATVQTNLLSSRQIFTGRP